MFYEKIIVIKVSSTCRGRTVRLITGFCNKSDASSSCISSLFVLIMLESKNHQTGTIFLRPRLPSVPPLLPVRHSCEVSCSCYFGADFSKSVPTFLGIFPKDKSFLQLKSSLAAFPVVRVGRLVSCLVRLYSGAANDQRDLSVGQNPRGDSVPGESDLSIKVFSLYSCPSVQL